MTPTFVQIDNKTINGKFIKNVVEMEGVLAVDVSQGVEANVTDPVEIAYLKAYMTAHDYFQLGSVYYNPDHVIEVYIAEDANHAYVMDSDGDEEAHTSLDEVQQLLEAAPTFVWTPPAPPASE